MKKIFSFLTLATVGTLALTGCKKEPAACLTTSKTEVAVNEAVTFNSCATNTSKVSWDFGDGSTGEGNSVSHAFAKDGVYMVTMAAENKGVKDRLSTLIKVTGTKTRYLKSIVIKTIPTNKPNGEVWDANPFNPPITIPGLPQDTAEPDINTTFSLGTGEYSLNLGTLNNANSSAFPKAYYYEPQNIKLTNADWKLVMSDSDFSLNLGTNPPSVVTTPDPMMDQTFNPYSTGADGKITLTQDGIEVEIYYTEN